jgi:sister-chromatid-cohesion protein PDS5
LSSKHKKSLKIKNLERGIQCFGSGGSAFDCRLHQQIDTGTDMLQMMARWLLGLKTDEVAAQKTFRMLNAIIENKGDLLEEGRPNPAERAWLRLGAGAAMLKICEQKGVGDQFTAEQYYNLARLMTDPVPQARF